MAFDPDEYLGGSGGGTAVADFNPDEYLGMVQPGNIDLNNRPVIHNPDGTVSTELSISIGTDKGEVLIPRVVNRKIVTNQEAIQHYEKTGEHLGIFDNPQDATAYAKALHERRQIQTQTNGFDPDEYLRTDQEKAEIARYGAPLTPEQRQGLAIQGPPVLPEGAGTDALGNIQGLPPQPGPLPDYLTQAAIDQGLGQGVDLGSIVDPLSGLRAQMQAKHLPPIEPSQEPDFYVDTPAAARRFAEETRGAIEEGTAPIDAWMRPAVEVKRPIGELPRWQDQPTLAGRINAAQLQALGGVVNTPTDLLNFGLSPAGALTGAVAEAGPVASRAVALGFSADQIRQGIQSDNLQDQVALALGAGLGFYGGLHPKAVEPVGQTTVRGPSYLQWNQAEQKWVDMGSKRALEPLPLSVPEVLEAQRFSGGPWVQAEPPEIPNRLLSGKYTATGQEITPEAKAPAAPEITQEELKAEVEKADNIPPGGAPSVAIDKAAESLPPTATAPANAGAVHRIRPEQVAVRPDLMQYKAALDPETGQTQEHKETIIGPWNDIQGGNLLLWEPIDPAAHGLTGEQKYIVANGHGRFYEINKQNVPDFNAQILKESDGVTAADARIQAAEANIKDGKGSIFDAANFIRGQAAAEGADAALERARFIGARGRKAATIAIHSTPDLYTSFINERISPDQAAAIAEAAPGQEGWQRIGIRKAIEEKWDQTKLYNFLQPLAEGKGRTPEPRMSQGGLFGDEDPAIKAMDEASDRAGSLQREIGESINAVQGAAKRPERAKAMGVDVTDKAAIDAKLLQLRALRERARQWSLDPQIFDIIYNRPEVSAPDALAELTRPKAEAPKPGETPPGLSPMPPENPVGPETGGNRWNAIENTYHTAKAASEALGVDVSHRSAKPGLWQGIVVTDKTAGAPAGKEPAIGVRWTSRKDFTKAQAELEQLFPSDRYGTKVITNVKPYEPRKGGLPSYKEWLAGKRPAEEAQPTPPPTDLSDAEQKELDALEAKWKADTLSEPEEDRIAELRRKLEDYLGGTDESPGRPAEPDASVEKDQKLKEVRAKYTENGQAPDRWLFVGCGKAKASDTTTARELYTGSLTKARMAHADRSGDPWLIMSAEHGLISPETNLAPYDTAITSLTPKERAEWAQKVAENATHLLGPDQKPGDVTIELHAGKEYTNLVKPLLENMGFNVETPVEGKGIGEQLQHYKASEAKAERPAGFSNVFEQNADFTVGASEGRQTLLRTKLGDTMANDVVTYTKPDGSEGRGKVNQIKTTGELVIDTGSGLESVDPRALTSTGKFGQGKVEEAGAPEPGNKFSVGAEPTTGNLPGRPGTPSRVEIGNPQSGARSRERASLATWFGESKVVDANGEPMVVYHASRSPEHFETFDPEKSSSLGIHFGTHEQANRIAELREGPSLEELGKGTRIYPAYLKLEHPFRFTRDLGFHEADELADYLLQKGVITEAQHRKIISQANKRGLGTIESILKSKGYDGYTYPNEMEAGGRKPEPSYAVFDSNQIRGKYEEGARGAEVHEAGAPEVRIATPREKEIAAKITDLMRSGMSFDDALDRIAHPLDEGLIRRDLVRSIAEAPLRKQADLFGGGNDPFNLVGETIKPSADGPDLGQGDLPAEKSVQQELFTEEPTSLGGGPAIAPDPADDPNFTALAVDLPEAVRFNDQLLGVAITIQRKLRALGGRAAGVFRYTRGHLGKGEIIMRADMADLLSPEEKQAMLDEAQAYAERVGQNAQEIRDIAAQRYKYLLDRAYDEAKKGPSTRALKVIWHEIGHAADWFGANWYKLMGSTDKTLERGNIFGHVAGLFDYLKDVIALDPFKPEGKPISSAEKARLREKALADMRQQIGPIQEIVETITQEEPELRVVGIQPEDVLSLINSNAARTELPELYKWFAEQSADTKKQIIKAAMRGMLDARLAAMGRTEVVGMRRVERTVRRTVGREPTQEEVNARFKELFEQELKRRNLAELETVKAELRNSIAWWRGTETIEPYFDNPKEMYAEAFSIFMNNPQALARRAPTYTRLLWNYMEARPEVSDIYAKLQNEIKSGQVKDLTEQHMTDGWNKADKRTVEKAQQNATSTSMSREDFLDNVVYNIDRRMGPVYRAAKGAPSEGALRAAIGNFNYRQTTHEAILNRINREIAHPLLANNLDWNDLARIMFYKRIFEERFAKFNPGGVDARRANDRLENMKSSLGPARFAALEKAQADLRKIYEDMVLGPMKAERMWNKTTQDYIDHNIYYATFDVIQDGKDGIEGMLHNVYGGQTSPHIYRQVGTLKEISNPATATVLKMLSLASATIRNEAKRLTIQVLHENELFRGEKVMEARTEWTGKRMEYKPINNRDIGTIVYMENGQPKAFYVRRVLADALSNSSGVDNKVFRAAVNATGWLKSAFTQLNYGFWPFNFVKDTTGWIMQMPGATPIDWAREIGPAIKAAHATVKGLPNPNADAALRRRMLISRADPRGIWSAVDDAYEIQLASYGLNPVAWTKEAKGVNGLVKAWNSYRELGQVVERANKIAGMMYLDRKYPTMPEWKKAEIVRERAGSPDFLQRGASNPQIDFFWLFYNPWKEGMRSVTQAARENPYSFTAKSTVAIVAPSIMQTLAASGAFGNPLKRLYRSVGDYDLSNFFVVPLGWADEDHTKATYLRLPLWEPARILHSMLWQFTTGRGAGLASTWGGQLPSLNSLIGIASMYYMYEVAGKNPYDFFRGKNILDDNTFAAGGWPAQRELLKQTWNSLGGSLLYQFQQKPIDAAPQTKIEKFLALPGVSNLVGRWIKVSDRGIGDLDQHIIAQDEQFRAQTRLAVMEVERKLLNNEGLADSEKRLMREPYAIKYFSDTFKGHDLKETNPIFRRLQNKTPEQKLMILQQNP